jgi:hypothetical protein
VGGHASASSGAAAPDTYKIRDNNTSRVWLAATAFTTGPSVSDTVYLTGVEDPAYSRNGYDAMFKEFDLGGGKIGGRCGDAFIKHTVGTKTVTLKSKVRRFAIDNGDGTTRDGIRLDLPAIGLINNLGTLCGETGGIGATPAETVEVTLPITAASAIPKRRVPTLGYRGTAYNRGRGEVGRRRRPGVDDPGCVRELPLSFPRLQERRAPGRRVREGRGRYSCGGRHASCRVGQRAHPRHRPHVDARPPRAVHRRRVHGPHDGYEDSDSLWLMAIEFDLRELNTTLGIGTLFAAGHRPRRHPAPLRRAHAPRRAPALARVGRPDARVPQSVVREFRWRGAAVVPPDCGLQRHRPTFPVRR